MTSSKQSLKRNAAGKTSLNADGPGTHGFANEKESLVFATTALDVDS